MQHLTIGDVVSSVLRILVYEACYHPLNLVVGVVFMYIFYRKFFADQSSTPIPIRVMSRIVGPRIYALSGGLTTKERAQRQIDRAKDTLVDITSTGDVSQAVADLLPLLAPGDRTQLARHLADVQEEIAEVFARHAELMEQPWIYDPARVSTAVELRAIEDAYRTLERDAQNAARGLDLLSRTCARHQAEIKDAGTTLAQADATLAEAQAAYRAYRADGFCQDLSRRLAYARGRLRAARAVLADKPGLALERANRATTACAQLTRTIEQERSNRARYECDLAGLDTRIEAQTAANQTAVAELARLAHRYGPASVEDVATADELAAMLREAATHRDEAELHIGKQDWPGTKTELAEADAVLAHLSRCTRTLTKVAEHLDQVFTSCEQRIREQRNWARRVCLAIHDRRGNNRAFKARVEAIIAGLDALERRLARFHPNYQEIDDELSRYQTELAEIDAASIAESERARDTTRA